jgi:phosphoglycolate phosphatase
MVGDRRHDVIAAKNNAVLSVGVTYGYGTKQELVDAGVDYVCDSPREVVTLIRNFELSRAREI